MKNVVSNRKSIEFFTCMTGDIMLNDKETPRNPYIMHNYANTTDIGNRLLMKLSF